MEKKRLEGMNPQELMEYTGKLQEALRPFAEAYERMMAYEEMSFDVCLYAYEDNCLTELFADGLGEQQLLTVGHLANAHGVL